MKTTGIIRRIDELGRLVIPKEMRKRFHLLEGDSVEFLINEEQEIVIRKYSIMKPWEQVSQKMLQTLKGGKREGKECYKKNQDSFCIRFASSLYQW